MRPPDSPVSMAADLERNRGGQPMASLMTEHGLRAQDLVVASPELITYKMVARACKGRWLTPHVRIKMRNALNAATGREYTLADLFNYQD